MTIRVLKKKRAIRYRGKSLVSTNENGPDIRSLFWYIGVFAVLFVYLALNVATLIALARRFSSTKTFLRSNYNVSDSVGRLELSNRCDCSYKFFDIGNFMCFDSNGVSLNEFRKKESLFESDTRLMKAAAILDEREFLDSAEGFYHQFYKLMAKFDHEHTKRAGLVYFMEYTRPVSHSYNFTTQTHRQNNASALREGIESLRKSRAEERLAARRRVASGLVTTYSHRHAEYETRYR
jgi:hypothetical protein